MRDGYGIMTVLPPFHNADGWHFYADGRLYGPYLLKSTADQRREDYIAFAVSSGVCGQASA